MRHNAWKHCSHECSQKTRSTRAAAAGYKWKIKQLYGITVEEYDAMYESQGGRCAICMRHQSILNGRFHIDHCHETNRVRGLLCSNCNIGIGNLQDDRNILLRAAAYV